MSSSYDKLPGVRLDADTKTALDEHSKKWAIKPSRAKLANLAIKTGLKHVKPNSK